MQPTANMTASCKACHPNTPTPYLQYSLSCCVTVEVKLEEDTLFRLAHHLSLILEIPPTPQLQ